MSVKLVAIDLDGTLIHSSHLPPENLAALRAAQSQGVTIVISTGRPYGSADAAVSQLGLGDTPIIAYNGAVIRMPNGGEVLFEAPVVPDLAAEIVALSVERRLHLHYYLAEVMYVPKVSKCSLIYYQRTGVVPVPVGDLRKFDGESPTKLLVCEEPEIIERLLPETQELYGDKLYVTRSMPEYLEFLSLDASKGKALQWLAEHYGLDISETMGIGDQLNDLPLVKAAGIGVAMPGADERLLAAADYVASNPEIGVAEALHRFVIEGSE